VKEPPDHSPCQLVTLSPCPSHPTRHISLPSLSQGRLCIALAALLWSTSGAFTKVLTQRTALGLDEPAIAPLVVGSYQLPVQIAFYRVAFAGLVLVPALRRGDFSFRGVMLVMAVCFAAMNVLFVSALALGTAANAVLLQYTAPMWMCLASVWLLGESLDRRSTVALAVGLFGIAVIIAGGWESTQVVVMAIALGSGLTYAGVMICLRVLRHTSSRWLTVWNHLCSALVLLPLIWFLSPPTAPQMLVLFCFGAFQMGLAYWLVARGLRVVNPQEAGAITLLEPVLNPLWAYLVSPATEVPPLTTFVGGAMIVGALAWRYSPWRRRGAASTL
jgi:DME family drug/metabolite transporter